MKVLMTVDTVGGVWSYAVTLSQALAPHGVELVIAAMGEGPSRADGLSPNARVVHAGNYKLEWMDDPWDDVRAAGDWLLDLESRVAPDVVHLNGYAHAALPWSAPVMVVAHSCVLSWWRAVRGGSAPGYWDRYRAAVREGLDAAELVVAPTRSMLAALEREHGSVQDARVIPNAVDPERLWHVPKEPYVFAAGRLWDDAKNIAALDRVAPALSWPVIVAGNNRDPDGRVRAYAHARPLGALAPAVLDAWLGCAAIYALPARYEPFGLSILEAALSRCALVLGDIPSLRENWDGCALFVQPDDDAGLRDVLRALTSDAAARRRLATGAYDHGRAEFGLDRMGAAYRDVYRDLCARHAVEVAACTS